jgi:hypothetical protein
MNRSLAVFKSALMRLIGAQTVLRENPENDRFLEENTWLLDTNWV